MESAENTGNLPSMNHRSDSNEIRIQRKQNGKFKGKHDKNKGICDENYKRSFLTGADISILFIRGIRNKAALPLLPEQARNISQINEIETNLAKTRTSGFLRRR